MRRKAQVLIIGLWILVILSILAIGVAHRVSLALRLSRYQRDKLRAVYLAKAAINIAIEEIFKDDISSDSLKDKWANNEERFKQISFNGNEDEFATVSYILEDGYEEEELIFGVVDEERKININTASQELLTELLIAKEIIDADKIANNIRAFRGDVGVIVPEYEELGYVNKSDKFSNINELILVKDISLDIYDAVKDLITVYPEEGKVNINTASKSILEILINTSFKKLSKRGIPVENPGGLLDSIMLFREEGGIFRDTNIETELIDLSNLQKNIINDSVDGLKQKITVKSRNFRIASQGNIKTTKLKSSIVCVFDREEQKLRYWYQN